MKTTKYAGTQTEKNLEAAFAGESQARNKYTYFASAAKREGYEHVFKQCTISLLMALLDCPYKPELFCKLREPFFLCCFGKFLIHICPFIVLSLLEQTRLKFARPVTIRRVISRCMRRIISQI